MQEPCADARWFVRFVKSGSIDAGSLFSVPPCLRASETTFLRFPGPPVSLL